MTRTRRLHLIPLESRVTPATIVDAFTVSYQDLDGDNVTVKLSKGAFTDQAAAESILTFAPAGVTGSNGIPQQLQSINLTGLGNGAKGTGITVTATRSLVNGGDGFAAVGSINATGFDIGDVVIDGDLGDISAGDSRFKNPCVGMLKVNSMGRYGTATGGTLTSNLTGKVGSITVKTSVVGAFIQVLGDADSKLGSLTIGGSLVSTGTNNSGTIQVAGDIGPIIIGGNLIGGPGAPSGSVITAGRTGDVTVRGSLLGADGARSGSIIADGGGMGIVTVKGDLRGGSGSESGALRADGGAVSVLVRGSLLGGGDDSGAVEFTGKVGPVTVLHDVAGGVGARSARVSGQTLGNVLIGGSMVGWDGPNSAEVAGTQAVGTVRVKGDVRGGLGDGSAAVTSGGPLGKVTVFGSLVGGAGIGSAKVSSVNDLGGVLTYGSIRGGIGNNSAEILSGGRLLSLTVYGSLVGGLGTATGAGDVRAGKDIGPIIVKGSIDGSFRPITITAVGSPAPLTTDIAIRSISVAGDVIGTTILAGYNTAGAPVNADAQVGPVSVLGDWVMSVLAAGVTAGTDGIFGTIDDAVILEAGQLPAVNSRIASIKIGGQAVGTPAGADGYGFVAQIVGVLSLGGASVPLHAGVANDSLLVGITLDVRLREV
jgi:hypothetical protein